MSTTNLSAAQQARQDVRSTGGRYAEMGHAEAGDLQLEGPVGSADQLRAIGERIANGYDRIAQGTDPDAVYMDGPRLCRDLQEQADQLGLDVPPRIATDLHALSALHRDEDPLVAECQFHLARDLDDALDNARTCNLIGGHLDQAAADGLLQARDGHPGSYETDMLPIGRTRDGREVRLHMGVDRVRSAHRDLDGKLVDDAWNQHVAVFVDDPDDPADEVEWEGEAFDGPLAGDADRLRRLCDTSLNTMRPGTRGQMRQFRDLEARWRAEGNTGWYDPRDAQDVIAPDRGHVFGVGTVVERLDPAVVDDMLDVLRRAS